MKDKPPELQPYQRELLERSVEERDGRLVPRRLVIRTPRRALARRLYERLRAILEQREAPE